MRRLAGVERRAEGAQTLKDAETARSQIFKKFQAQQTENDNLKWSMADLEERLSDVCKAHETELADMNAANAVVKAKTASAEAALHSKDAQLDELKERLAALEEVLEKIELPIEIQLKVFELKRTLGTIIENIRRTTSILTDSAIIRLILPKLEQDFIFINIDRTWDIEQRFRNCNDLELFWKILVHIKVLSKSKILLKIKIMIYN